MAICTALWWRRKNISKSCRISRGGVGAGRPPASRSFRPGLHQTTIDSVRHVCWPIESELTRSTSLRRSAPIPPASRSRNPDSKVARRSRVCRVQGVPRWQAVCHIIQRRATPIARKRKTCQDSATVRSARLEIVSHIFVGKFGSSQGEKEGFTNDLLFWLKKSSHGGRIHHEWEGARLDLRCIKGGVPRHDTRKEKDWRRISSLAQIFFSVGHRKSAPARRAPYAK